MQILVAYYVLPGDLSAINELLLLKKTHTEQNLQALLAVSNGEPALRRRGQLHSAKGAIADPANQLRGLLHAQTILKGGNETSGFFRKKLEHC